MSRQAVLTEVQGWLLRGLDDQSLTSSSPLAQALFEQPGPARSKAVEAFEHYDPHLATRTLQTANSVLFGLTRRIRNLSEGLDVLGAQMTQALMTVTEVLLAFQGVSPARISFAQFEAYAVRVGRLAHRFAAPEDAPHALMAAALLDVGKLVLATQRPAEFGISLDATLESRRPAHLVELEVFGTQHAQIGSELLRRWQLPDSVVRIVLAHHDPVVSPTPLVAAVHAADTLLGIHACGDPLSTFEEQVITECVGAPTVMAWRAMAEEEASRSLVVTARGERLPSGRFS